MKEKFHLVEKLPGRKTIFRIAAAVTVGTAAVLGLDKLRRWAWMIDTPSPTQDLASGIDAAATTEPNTEQAATNNNNTPEPLSQYNTRVYTWPNGTVIKCVMVGKFSVTGETVYSARKVLIEKDYIGENDPAWVHDAQLNPLGPYLPGDNLEYDPDASVCDAPLPQPTPTP